MFLDIAALVLVALVAILGWRAGALHAIVRLGAFTAAFLLSRPLGAALASDVRGWMPGHPGLAGHLATFLAATGLLAVFWLLGSITVRVLRGAQAVRGADALLGMVLGVGKGAALAYALLCFSVALERPMTQAFPAFGAQLGASVGARWAREGNVVEWLLDATGGPGGAGAPATPPPTPPAPAGAPQRPRSRVDL